MNVGDVFQSKEGCRWGVLVEYVNKETRERICMRIMDDMRRKRIMRDDRMIPTDKDGAKLAWAYKDMNRSDGEWIEDVIFWKKNIGLDPFEEIQITDYEQGWIDFLTDKIDDIPVMDKSEAEIPF
jgi:hypothetical protein